MIKKENLKQEILALSGTQNFLTNVQDLYKENLVAVVATGSRTTGEFTEESDLDLDIILSNETYKGFTKKTLHALKADYSFLKQKTANTKIKFWPKTVLEYTNPKKFKTKSSLEEGIFSLDGYGGICNYVLLNEIRDNGIVLLGSDVIGQIPNKIKRVPKYEGMELHMIARRDLFLGYYFSNPKLLAKAVLRAANAKHIAGCNETFTTYKAVKKATNKRLITEAYKVKLGAEIPLDLSKVIKFIDDTLPEIEYEYKHELRTRNFEDLAKQNFYYQTFAGKTTRKLLELFIEEKNKDWDMRILDFCFGDFTMHFEYLKNLNREGRLNERVDKTDDNLLLKYIEKLIKYYGSKGDTDSKCNIASAYLRLGKPIEALASAQTVLDSDKNSIDALELKVCCLLDLEKFDEAEGLLHILAKKEPDETFPWYNLGWIHHQMKDYSQAIMYYRRALDSCPVNWDTISGLADVLDQAGDCAESPEQALDFYNESIKHYQRWLYTLSFDPYMRFSERSDMLSDFGTVLRKIGAWKDARKLYALAIWQFDGNYAAWSNKGNIELITHKYKNALKCYTKALGIKPDFVNAWLGKGQCYQMMGQYANALECYDYVIANAPGSEMCTTAILKQKYLFDHNLVQNKPEISNSDSKDLLNLLQ